MLLDTLPASHDDDTPLLAEENDDDTPPPYQDGSSSLDTKPISSRATDATDSGDTIHNSVEDDEAIGGVHSFLSDANAPVMSQALSNVYSTQNWRWPRDDGNNLTGDGQTASVAEGETTEVDADADIGGSDKAQHDSPVDVDDIDDDDDNNGGGSSNHYQFRSPINLDAMDYDGMPPELDSYGEPDEPVPDANFNQYEEPAAPEPDPETAATLPTVAGLGHRHDDVHGHRVISVPPHGNDDEDSSNDVKEIIIDGDTDATDKQ